MADGYERASLDDVAPNPEKPSDRWEISKALGTTAYNYNVAVVDPGERLSRTAYHAHPNQREFFHVVDGRCRVEAPDGSFDVATDDVLLFEAGVPHMLYNPYDAPCKLVAVGAPPDGHHPVEQVQSFDEVMAERYPERTDEGRDSGD
ncbi:MAG: cupin domain-containing protein [Haloferacaceae archaeon]